MTPLSLAEVARRRRALQAQLFSSPLHPVPGHQRDENQEEREEADA